MISVNDAFKKFKSRLELSEKEQKNASKRHTEVRDFLDSKFDIETSFLTGSYKRHTKTKPLKDIDIFFVMKDSESDYRDKAPSTILSDIKSVLSDEYGHSAVTLQSHSICVDFGVEVDADDNTDHRIVSIDVVPSFRASENYEIPYGAGGEWIKTNPKVHEQKAVDAHQAFSNEWKGLVRMVKYWNNSERHGQKPVKPSFLIEVMALECLHGGWQGQYDREVQFFFSTLADRVHDEWPDPAGLGPPVSDGMDSARKQRAQRLLQTASAECTQAIQLAKQGRNGDSLKAWRALFGPKFPLS